MTDILSSHVVPSPDAAESAVGAETVLLHLKSGTYYGLDPVGTRIWSLLKEGLVPSEICRRIAAEYAVGLETVEDDTRRFLSELKSHDILVDA